jgi:hypothetical protein
MACALSRESAENFRLPDACDSLSVDLRDSSYQYKYFAYSSNNFEEVLLGSNHDQIAIQFVAQVAHKTLVSKSKLKLLEDGYDIENYSVDTPGVVSFFFDTHDGLAWGTLELSIGGKRATWKKYPGYNSLNKGKLFTLIINKDETYHFFYDRQLMGEGHLRDDFKYHDDDSPNGNLRHIEDTFDILTSKVSGIGFDGVVKGEGQFILGYLLIADSHHEAEIHNTWIIEKVAHRQLQRNEGNVAEETAIETLKQVIL